MERNRYIKNMDNHSVCVLVSGGLDSCVLLCEMIKKFDKVYPVYVNNGMLWEKAEKHWLKKFLDTINNKFVGRLKVINLNVKDIYQNHWSITGKGVPDHTRDDSAVYLPGRNIILFSKAAIFCSISNIHTIALAPLKANCFPDGTRRFFNSFQNTISMGLNFKISIITPFLELSKKEVIKIGANLPLEYTFSCVKPSGIYHCGECIKCGERKEAFKELDIEDKTIYKV